MWCFMSNHRDDPLISLRNITKKYALLDIETVVLNDISLHVHIGDMLAIVGTSGSGKSTLMNVIGLLDKIDSGEYRLQGKNINGLHDDELSRLRNQYIGFVFQQFHLLPRFTALQNVVLPLTYRDVPAGQAARIATEALSRVGMASFANRRPLQLSGGQQQRVAIARALVGEPQVILADEPTGALDGKTSYDIMRLFASLHAEGRTLILVTHDERVAAECERQIILQDGEIVADSAR